MELKSFVLLLMYIYLFLILSTVQRYQFARPVPRLLSL